MMIVLLQVFDDDWNRLAPIVNRCILNLMDIYGNLYSPAKLSTETEYVEQGNMGIGSCLGTGRVSRNHSACCSTNNLTTEVYDMMTYKLFKQIMTERIKDYLPESFTFYEVKLKTVYKTNEKLDSMTLVPMGDPGNILCPNIYLNDLYKEFQECQDLDLILRTAAGVVVKYSTFVPKDFDFNLKERKEFIIINVLNTERNKELLDMVPHREILDFSIIYRVVMRLGDDGLDTILITNEIADDLDMTEDELFEAAAENTRKILPLKLLTITELSANIRLSKEEQDDYLKMCHEPVIATNDSYIQGSSYLSQPEVLRSISEKIGDDYYAVPSSVNEFFVLPARIAKLDVIRELLRKDNMETNSIRDILSDNVYYYDRGREELMMA